MPQPVAERIQKLPDEIAEITEMDAQYMQETTSGKNRAESRR